VKALIDEKLAEAASDKRVSTLKAKKAIEVARSWTKRPSAS